MGEAKVTVEADKTKNRKGAVLPLAESAAAALRDWRQEHAEDDPLFPLPQETARMLRDDLDAAGIDYTIKDGYTDVDFHSLRTTFVTNLARAGVHPKVAQMLARHGSIVLTMDFYTALEVLDYRGALEAGVNGTAAADEPQRARRVG